MGNASCNACHRVTVTAEGYCFSYGVFEIFGLEEGYYGLRYGTLRRHIKTIFGSYIVQGAAEVIGEVFLYLAFYKILIFALAGKKNRKSRRLSAFYSFGVIVSNRGASFRFFHDRFNGIEGKAYGAHSHGGAIAPAVVRP